MAYRSIADSYRKTKPARKIYDRPQEKEHWGFTRASDPEPSATKDPKLTPPPHPPTVRNCFLCVSWVMLFCLLWSSGIKIHVTAPFTPSKYRMLQTGYLPYNCTYVRTRFSRFARKFVSGRLWYMYSGSLCAGPHKTTFCGVQTNPTPDLTLILPL